MAGKVAVNVGDSEGTAAGEFVGIVDGETVGDVVVLTVRHSHKGRLGA